MIIQITATNLLNRRPLIAEVECNPSLSGTRHATTTLRQIALRKLRQWHRERPMERVYRLDDVEIIER
jgi:hypothetical protein